MFFKVCVVCWINTAKDIKTAIASAKYIALYTVFGLTAIIPSDA
jgi:hypothetical protein